MSEIDQQMTELSGSIEDKKCLNCLVINDKKFDWALWHRKRRRIVKRKTEEKNTHFVSRETKGVRYRQSAIKRYFQPQLRDSYHQQEIKEIREYSLILNKSYLNINFNWNSYYEYNIGIGRQ